MNPTIGRIVLYRLNEQDVAEIEKTATSNANNYDAGDVVPAIIVAVWGDTPDAYCNLQCILDDPGCPIYWATSRKVGDDPGDWRWPVKA